MQADITYLSLSFAGVTIFLMSTHIDQPESLTIRSLAHGIAAIVIMGFYGGMVCPFVDGLDLEAWFLELSIIIGAIFAARKLIVDSVITRFTAANKVAAQFWFELSIFLLIGIVVSATNLLVHSFPLESGLKMLFGAAALGFFAGTDIGLARERILATLVARKALIIQPEIDFYPITRKFAVFATLTAIIVTTTILLVLVKDLDWIFNTPGLQPTEVKTAVLKEIIFISVIFLAYIVNLILSYSHNLKRLMDEENQALKAVSEGNLARPVNVYTNDEFGIMGQYTNNMIRELGDSRTQLEQAHRELIDSERLRAIGEFASTIAHEVRSPLHVVQLMLDYFDKQTLAEGGRKRLGLAQTEVTRLASLMNEILLYAKPQQLIREKLNLSQALNDWIDIFETQPAARQKNIELHLPDEPIWIEADADKIKQAALNLVTNAYDAAPTDSSIQLYLSSYENGCRLEVRNEGTPIPTEQLQRLMEPFFTTKQGGTGLGLPIVKRIAEAHGGTLSITSTEKRGTSVSLDLPINDQATELSPVAPTSAKA